MPHRPQPRNAVKSGMTRAALRRFRRRKFLSGAGAGALGALLSGCGALAKLDKGLYGAHQSATEEDLITGKRVIGSASREEQISEGNASMEKAVSDYSAFNEDVDRRAYARLKKIFDRVHAVSHYANEEWEVLLLPDDNFNAFVTGGTYVAVFKGLMDQVPDDAAVAAVLGHEIGHVTANHVFERESSLFNLLDGQTGLDFAYGALQEEEADKIGAVYAALAGYDPRSISKVWAAFAGSNQWSWFRTHPASDDRARATRILGERASEYYIPGAINPDHGQLARCNSLWCNR